MNKLAIAMLLMASPAFAQNKDVAPDLRDCPPTGQTAKGEMVYSLDCKALKAENKDVNYKPDMPATNLPDPDAGDDPDKGQVGSASYG
jgi:hypothetical protein